MMIKFKAITIELRLSKISGVGVFAARNIEKNEVVAEGIHKEDYSSLVSWQVVKSVDNNIKNKIYAFCIGTPEGFFPPEKYDFNNLSIEWYINHSCSGNIGFNKTGDFIALRNIKKNEELTYDYGLAESNPKFKMICNCKSKNCRKLITGNDWKHDDFRKKYHSVLFPLLRNQ